jgi:hypothetical protein
MSYEKNMLEKLAMPTRKQVEQALLQSLLMHGGVIKEFGAGQEIVDEIANEFGLNEQQRLAFLQTIYRKENRIKKSLLWHRLLFRAADSLAKEKLVSRPTQTFKLTNKREWMLTEKGFDDALTISKFPIEKKNYLLTKSYEVQKIVNKLNESKRPKNYNPFDKEKKVSKVTRESILRTRGFRLAVIEAYSYKCAICGLKINSPDSLSWEVEAAHIVPNRSMGRDDIWNGLALCHLHHWAFDVGWFTLQDDYAIQVSKQVNSLLPDYGKLGNYNIIRALLDKNNKILLPSRRENYPHENAIHWHRENIFY